LILSWSQHRCRPFCSRSTGPYRRSRLRRRFVLNFLGSLHGYFSHPTLRLQSNQRLFGLP
jgi:hypothetical protein